MAEDLKEDPGVKEGQSSSGSPTARYTADALAIFNRVKAIAVDPKGTWPVIKAEPTTDHDLYTKFFIPLAAIGPVCTFLHVLATQGRLFFPLFSQLVVFAMSLAGAYVWALVLERLGPKYGASTDRLSALKLAVYAQSPALLAGVFYLIGFGFIPMVASLYSLYLFIVGVPPMTGVPEERKWPYIIVSAAVMIGIAVVFAIVFSVLVSSFAPVVVPTTYYPGSAAVR